MQSAALSAREAAQFINISERRFHQLRADAGFPKPRNVGGRNRWLAEELAAYLRALPAADPKPEPPQLRGSLKQPAIEPRPEAWPPPPGAADLLAKAPRKRKTLAADDAARPE